MGAQVRVVAVGRHAGGVRGRAGAAGLGLVYAGAWTALFARIRGFTGLFAVCFGGVGALLT